MRRYALHVLLLLNLALIGILAWLWVTPAGALRNVHWSPPAPHSADYASMVPALPGVSNAGRGQFMAMLDRPLFSMTRRPPPPPPPPAPPAPVDTLSTARLFGVFEGGGIGGVILNIGGKNRRVRLNEVVDGWTVKAIQGRDVTFSSNGATRVLQLPRAALKAYTGLAVPIPAPLVQPPARPPAPSGGATPPPAQSSGPSFGTNRR